MDTNRFDTDRYVVDAFSAEQLARSFDEFSATDIRELLEGELVPDAMKLLAHYRRKAAPYQELKQFSVRSGLGFYKAREDRISPEKHYEHYLHLLSVKDEEHHANTGCWLAASQREHITHEFYAPAYRAEMNKLCIESRQHTQKRQSPPEDGPQNKVA